MSERHVCGSLIACYSTDKVFKDQLPVCTKDGCANIPEEIGSKPCEGLIKPGNHH